MWYIAYAIEKGIMVTNIPETVTTQGHRRTGFRITDFINAEESPKLIVWREKILRSLGTIHILVRNMLGRKILGD